MEPQRRLARKVNGLELPSSLRDPASAATAPAGAGREAVGVDGAFRVSGLLSAEEAAALVEAAERVGFTGLEHEFDAQERNKYAVLPSRSLARSLPVSLSAAQLARAGCGRAACRLAVPAAGAAPDGGRRALRQACGLWQRWVLAPHEAERMPQGCIAFPRSMVFTPPSLQIGKYLPDQHFAEHMDGPWVPRDDESSIYTVVIYLSDAQAGGETLFHLESDPNVVLASVAPRAGDCVVFFHDTVHSSAPLQAGCKYVLRTELMFARVNTGDIPQPLLMAYESLPTYQKMVRVYAESQEAFFKGNIADFTRLYKDAIAIQRDASPRPAAAQRFGRSQLPFPADICIMIFSHLDLSTLLKGVSLCSKQFRELCFDGRIWTQLYDKYFLNLNLCPEDNAPFFYERNAERRAKSRSLSAQRELRALASARRAAASSGHDDDLTGPGSELARELHDKKVLMQRRLGHSVSTDAFVRFRNESRALRRTLPAAAVDCLAADKLVLGFQFGAFASTAASPTWDERVHNMPNVYCKHSYGEYHYRTTHTYYGADALARCKEDQELTAQKLTVNGGPAHPALLGECVRKQAVPYSMSIDACLIIEPPRGLTSFQRSQYERAFPTSTLGFINVISLLGQHFCCDADTLLVGSHRGELYCVLCSEPPRALRVLFKEDLASPRATALAIQGLHIKFSKIAFAGALPSGGWRDNLLQLLQPSHGNVQDVTSDDDPALVAVKAATALFRSVFFRPPRPQ